MGTKAHSSKLEQHSPPVAKYKYNGNDKIKQGTVTKSSISKSFSSNENKKIVFQHGVRGTGGKTGKIPTIYLRVPVWR